MKEKERQEAERERWMGEERRDREEEKGPLVLAILGLR